MKAYQSRLCLGVLLLFIPSLVVAQSGTPDATSPRGAVSFLSFSAPPAFAAIDHDPALEPPEEGAFLLSVQFVVRALPSIDEPVLLVSKYAATAAPNPGWALGLTRYETSLRPAFYWRSRQGKGGWFPFDAATLELGKWYTLTAFVSGDEFVTAYLHDGGEEVTFLGGQELGKIGSTQTTERLTLGRTRTNREAFRGAITEVLIAKPKVLPKDIASAKEFVEGGGEAMLKGLSAEEVLFFLSKRGRDESQYQRAVTLEGKARWEEEQR